VIVSTGRATLLGLAGIEVIGSSGDKFGVMTVDASLRSDLPRTAHAPNHVHTV
jgi:hypothetical protein